MMSRDAAGVPVAIWLLGAAWWIRWLAWAGLLAVVVAATWGVMFADVRNGLAHWWSVGLVGAFSVAIGALIAALQQPKHREYVAAMAGLDPHRRSQALRALSRNGPIPDDSAVVAVARRVANLTLGDRSRGRSFRRQKTLQAVVIGRWILGAVAQLLAGDVQGGLRWAWLGLVLAAAIAWDWYEVRRMVARAEVLGSAAAMGK